MCGKRRGLCRRGCAATRSIDHSAALIGLRHALYLLFKERGERRAKDGKVIRLPFLDKCLPVSEYLDESGESSEKRISLIFSTSFHSLLVLL